VLRDGHAVSELDGAEVNEPNLMHALASEPIGDSDGEVVDGG
jgi:hypothetical protein